MLKPNPKKKSAPAAAAGLRFAIVASRYNAKYVDSMLDAATRTLEAAGATSVEVVRVPGAFEVPVVASQLIHGGVDAPDAIVCLGLVIQGETTHADHVSRAATDALMQLQVAYRIPCVHEVLQVRDASQAKARCLDPKTNRGVEAAQTAIDMARTLRDLRERRRLPL